MHVTQKIVDPGWPRKMVPCWLTGHPLHPQTCVDGGPPHMNVDYKVMACWCVWVWQFGMHVWIVYVSPIFNWWVQTWLLYAVLNAYVIENSSQRDFQQMVKFIQISMTKHTDHDGQMPQIVESFKNLAQMGNTCISTYTSWYMIFIFVSHVPVNYYWAPMLCLLGVLEQL